MSKDYSTSPACRLLFKRVRLINESENRPALASELDDLCEFCAPGETLRDILSFACEPVTPGEWLQPTQSPRHPGEPAYWHHTQSPLHRLRLLHQSLIGHVSSAAPCSSAALPSREAVGHEVLSILEALQA